MTNAERPLAWVQSIKREIALEAFHILDDMIEQYDLGKRGRIRIRGHAHGAPEFVSPSGDDPWVARRREVAAMLVGRRVLSFQEARYVGGPYVQDAEVGDWLFVEADEETVRDVAMRLQERLKPVSAVARRASSSAPAVGTQIVHGSVTNVTTTGDNARVSVTVSNSDLESIRQFIEGVEAAVQALKLDPTAAKRLQEELEAIKAESNVAEPNPRSLKKGVGVVTDILKKAAATALARLLITAGASAIHHL